MSGRISSFAAPLQQEYLIQAMNSQLVDYLLGRLPQNERDEISGRLFTDPGVLDELDHARASRRREQPHAGTHWHGVRRLGYGVDSDHPAERGYGNAQGSLRLAGEATRQRSTWRGDHA